MTHLRALTVAAALGLGVLSASPSLRAESCNPPRILFVLDSSTSMLAQIDDAGTPTTKWKALQAAVAAVFKAYPDAAQYGLMTFPGPAGQCSTGTVTVPVGPGTAGTIQTTINGLVIPSNNQTPAGQSLVAASKYTGIINPANANYVIFMTDGWQYCSIPQVSGAPLCASGADCSAMSVSPCPTCNSCQTSSTDPACSGKSADGCFCVRTWPIKGVEALKAAGVPTYVVGFGNATDVETLNKAAAAGGTALAGCNPNSTTPSCYLQATSPKELTNALSNIVQAVVTEKCKGECGIEGSRTCTAAGWSGCDAPKSTACSTACGAGTQKCESGVLGPCEPGCPDAGTDGGGGSAGAAGSAGSAGAGASGGGGSGATGATGGGGAGATGGTGATDAGLGGDSGKDDDSGDDGGCGCRSSGAPASRGLWLLAGAALLLVRRRRIA